MRNRTLLLSTVVCLTAFNVASAQSVNYGQLEQFFGEPVTSSATGSPQKATDAPANMEIISTDDIRHSGATNIPDILRFVSGLDIREYGRGNYDVSVRGYNQPNAPRLLVLVNGRQVYSDDFGYVAWDSIPVQLDEIRQIEVIKGPNSALFGFNAVGGVINIITYDPLNDKINSVTARAGTDGYAGGSAVGTFHWGDSAGLRLSAGGYRDDQARPTNQAPAGSPFYDTSPNQRSFSADGRLQLAPNVLATLEGTSSQSQHSDFVLSYGWPGYSTSINNSGKLGLAADTSLGLLTLSAYRNDQHYTVYSTTGVTGLDNISYVVEANDLFKVGADHTIRVGGEYRNNDAIGGLFGNSTGYQVYAGNVMWNWQINPSLSLTNSLRIDHLALYRTDPVAAFSPYSLTQYQNGTTTEPSYNSGLVYKLSDNDTIRALASQGVQAPSLIDYGVQRPITSGPYTIGVTAGNPDVHAATVTNEELDYDRELKDLQSILRMSVYVQKTRDIIQPELLTPPIFVRRTPQPLFYLETQNIGNSSAVGGEVGIKGKANGWRWNASYSYIKIKDQLSLNYSLATPYAVDFKDGTPTNVLIAGLGYSVGDWEFDTNSRWQSRFTDFETNTLKVIVPITIKNYLTSDVRVGYRLFESTQVAVTAQQLNQATSIQNSGYPIDRRVLFSVNTRF